MPKSHVRKKNSKKVKYKPIVTKLNSGNLNNLKKLIKELEKIQAMSTESVESIDIPENDEETNPIN